MKTLRLPEPKHETRHHLLAVAVHCGSAHVRGKARGYAYFVASLFEATPTADGRMIYRNTGISTRPRRSRKLADADARLLAAEHGATYGSPTYGSLHNAPWVRVA